MSISGAMNTAVSGLNAESAALASISNNVANSQTVGFKQADTSFVDYLTQTNASTDGSSSVVAKPASKVVEAGVVVLSAAGLLGPERRYPLGHILTGPHLSTP